MLTAGAGAALALLSCAFKYLSARLCIFLLQRLHLKGGKTDHLSLEGEKKKKRNLGMAFNTTARQKGQQGVRRRLRPKTGVLLPCLVNSEMQSHGLPVPLSVLG